MKVIQTSIPDVLILEPRVFKDERGFLFESYNKRELDSIGITADFVQENHSCSVRNVLRGLHYQLRQPQGKLIRVIAGAIFDVAVDIRLSSSTFGKWVAVDLSAANKRIMWIPPGFAHGFAVLSDVADLVYKSTDFWAPRYERCIIWNDPDLAISWPFRGDPILSAKDKAGCWFKEAEPLP